jgi:hypothetical protein
MKYWLALALGLFCGGLLAAYYVGASDNAAVTSGGISLSSLPRLGIFEGTPTVSDASGPVALRDRLAVYREAVGSDRDSLLRSLRAAARSQRAARDFEIDAALAVLAELDPALALDEALALGLDADFVMSVVELWAAADRNAALAGVARIDDSSLRRQAARGLLEYFDAAHVAAALPAADRAWLTVAELEFRAHGDPAGAFDAALTLGDEDLRGRALTAVGTAWARRDPLGAMARADRLSRAQRLPFVQAVGAEWARLDATSFLSYLGTAPMPDELLDAAVWAVAADPEAVLRIAESMPAGAGDLLRNQAMSTIARRDPVAAIAYANVMPPGEERGRMLQQIGSAYASRDPQAAVGWAQSLVPPSREAEMGILSGLAEADPVLALDFLEQGSLTVSPDVAVGRVVSIVSRNSKRAAELAEQLYSRDDPAARDLLGNLVSVWGIRHPDAAIDWALSKGNVIDGAVLASAAERWAAQDPRAAADHANRLSPDLRDDWIVAIAGQYAGSDPAAATNWILGFQGQAGFDEALGQVIQKSAATDPQSAATLLTHASPEIARSAAPAVASSWAMRVPSAAARWANGLDDPLARSEAVTRSVSVWAASDLPAAERWVLTLPEDEDRDRALTAVLQERVTHGAVNPVMLDAFSDDLARQAAIANSLGLVARRNVDEARVLLDEHVKDPTLRERAEVMIEMGQRGNSLFVPLP